MTARTSGLLTPIPNAMVAATIRSLCKEGGVYAERVDGRGGEESEAVERERERERKREREKERERERERERRG